jgi:hypothetical protein
MEEGNKPAMSCRISFKLRTYRYPELDQKLRNIAICN